MDLIFGRIALVPDDVDYLEVRLNTRPLLAAGAPLGDAAADQIEDLPGLLAPLLRKVLLDHLLDGGGTCDVPASHVFGVGVRDVPLPVWTLLVV